MRGIAVIWDLFDGRRCCVSSRPGPGSPAVWVSALSCTSHGDVKQTLSLCVYGRVFVIFKALPLILVAEDGNGVALFLVWPYTRACSLQYGGRESCAPPLGPLALSAIAQPLARAEVSLRGGWGFLAHNFQHPQGA